MDRSATGGVLALDAHGAASARTWGWTMRIESVGKLVLAGVVLCACSPRLETFEFYRHNPDGGSGMVGYPGDSFAAGESVLSGGLPFMAVSEESAFWMALGMRLQTERSDSLSYRQARVRVMPLNLVRTGTGGFSVSPMFRDQDEPGTPYATYSCEPSSALDDLRCVATAQGGFTDVLPHRGTVIGNISRHTFPCGTSKRPGSTVSPSASGHEADRSCWLRHRS